MTEDLHKNINKYEVSLLLGITLTLFQFSLYWYVKKYPLPNIAAVIIPSLPAHAGWYHANLLGKTKESPSCMMQVSESMASAVQSTQWSRPCQN